MTPMVAFINQAVIPGGLMLIMFSLGLTLVLRDFANVVSGGRNVVTGFGIHLFLLPLLGLAIGVLFRLPPDLALGLFIISICPAGTTSNALTFVGRGNVALAVTLTVLTSLVTVFTIPLLLSWEMVLQHVLAATPAIFALNVCAMAVGLTAGRLLGANTRDRMTLAIETGVQNATLALFLTMTVLGNMPLAVTQNIYGVIMLFNATLLIRWFRPRIPVED